MNLSNLTKTTTKAKRRLGRGYGSGRAKTAGRGTKGQKARAKVKLLFTGSPTESSWVKRLPMLRGKWRNKPLGKKPVILNLKYLNLLPDKTIVDLETLIKRKMVKEDEARIFGVKILGEGNLTKPLTVKLPVSAGARRKIKAAGGSTG